MSRWNIIGTDEVLDELTPAEQKTLENIQGATSALPKILQRTISKLRGDCLRGGNRIGPDNTVPDSQRPNVVAYTRWRWLTSIPQAKAMQTPERKEAYEEARDEFRLIAKGDVKTELPEADEVIDANTPGNAAQLVTQPDPARAANRKKLDGLI